MKSEKLELLNELIEKAQDAANGLALIAAMARLIRDDVSNDLSLAEDRVDSLAGLTPDAETVERIQELQSEILGLLGWGSEG